jgi:hypothetical protein
MQSRQNFKNIKHSIIMKWNCSLSILLLLFIIDVKPQSIVEHFDHREAPSDVDNSDAAFDADPRPLCDVLRSTDYADGIWKKMSGDRTWKMYDFFNVF